MSETRVLIVDDEPEMLENLDRLLSAEGYRCTTLQDPTLFHETLGETDPDIVISDVRMPQVDGLTILAQAQAEDPGLPVILITGYATVDSAIQAIGEGAFDYLAKPFTADQLSVVVKRAVRYRGLMLENQALRRQLDPDSLATIVGSSPRFVRLLDQAQRVAKTEANVLVVGESGTGKEVIARAIHAASNRRDRPFVPVDCAALPEGLLESELFGHEKGAFTGAVNRTKGLLTEGDRGTIFLDEVGELTPPLQAKLLRVLEDRSVRPVGATQYHGIDVRMIAATNRDLEAAVADGGFREDLFYRLNVVKLTVPPLRERNSDVLLLAEHFIESFSRKAGRSPPAVSSEVWEALESYAWPGNVRQLKNLVERVVALDSDGRVTLSDLPIEMRFGRSAPPAPDLPAPISSVRYAEAREEALRRFQESYVTELLRLHGGNVSQAAEAAGVSRRTFHRWLAEVKENPHPQAEPERTPEST